MAEDDAGGRPAHFAAVSELPKAEPGPLPMTGDSTRDNTAWIEMARGLVNQTLAALKAAEAGNSDGTGIAARI